MKTKHKNWDILLVLKISQGRQIQTWKVVQVQVIPTQVERELSVQLVLLKAVVEDTWAIKALQYSSMHSYMAVGLDIRYQSKWGFDIALNCILLCAFYNVHSILCLQRITINLWTLSEIYPPQANSSQLSFKKFSGFYVPVESHNL